MKFIPPRPLLDRFLDQAGPRNLDGYADLVLRDVEALLNTRRASVFGDEEDLLAYGLPDMTVTGRTESQLAGLAWRIGACLEKYEPRLRQVKVETQPSSPENFDRLTVRITAVLAGFEKGPVLSLEMSLPVGPAVG